MDEMTYKCSKCGLVRTVPLTEKDNLVSACLKIERDHAFNSFGCSIEQEGQLRIVDCRLPIEE
jgi:hypothetical protein